MFNVYCLLFTVYCLMFIVSVGVYVHVGVGVGVHVVVVDDDAMMLLLAMMMTALMSGCPRRRNVTPMTTHTTSTAFHSQSLFLSSCRRLLPSTPSSTVQRESRCSPTVHSTATRLKGPFLFEPILCSAPYPPAWPPGSPSDIPTKRRHARETDGHHCCSCSTWEHMTIKNTQTSTPHTHRRPPTLALQTQFTSCVTHAQRRASCQKHFF